MSRNLSTGFFHSEWYQEDVNYRNCAVIFMEYLKKPIKITAIGLFDINLESFTTICNAAYSLFAVFKKA